MADYREAESHELQVPLTTEEDRWRDIFNKYDRNGNGTINLIELKVILEGQEYDNDIPDHVVKLIFKKADTNMDGELDFDEFMRMVMHPNNQQFFQHLKRGATQYINFMVPRKYHEPVTDVDNRYEDQFNCWPPAIGMIIISIVEIILYCIDLSNGYDNTKQIGPIAAKLLYDPRRRIECWRYVTYMFVHIGSFHLIVNVCVQVLLGIPLEMVHKGWRILTIYFAGVLAGSLGTSVADPTIRLAGASGGVYAIMTAHLATIIMNWSEMTYPFIQLIIFLIIIGSDVGTSIYNRYVLQTNETVGYAAHFFGALAGLLVGIFVLRNIDVKKGEVILKRVAIVVYIILMLTAIIWNAFFPDYFPPQVV